MTFLKLMMSGAMMMSLILNQANLSTEYPEQDRPEDLAHEENSCVGLNYHRVRDYGVVENVFRLLSSNKELSVYSVSTEAFESQMKFLRDQDANFVTMEELIGYYEEGNFPERCVWVSFDDMDTTIRENAHPILEKYSIPATGFVITGEVGNEDFNNISLLEQEQLNEMEASGLWEFSTHTHDFHHLDGNTARLLTKNEEEVKADTQASQDYFESEFDGKDINSIAYPFGQANDTAIEVFGDQGIDYGFTLEEKEIRPDSHPYYIPRVLVSEDAFELLIEDWEGLR
ncbi:intercellular adhesin biosynthesis polysaccharide N-deacetylase [Salinicoccus roseus]|uniref:intercellular adhesin biosynthesis polysaccharide N-deacetylase n=1 Tax=Salinicoccus roseus TaxID=45670 RepID=UPI001EF4798F|nr:intercellular adhesin biosynthesis polysaccharide N-deacetylase [Salinicoccus roseus]MCG7331672.1 intercellular adhesin biosynthesis polysaccharide N-deacetylase [Salinicoccus roseus]